VLNTVSATVSDPAGYVELDVSEENPSGVTRRRISRISTLDGGVVVNDGGYSPGDRTLELSWVSSSKATIDSIERLIRLYNRVNVATRAGVFLAAPGDFTPGIEKSKLTLLVLDQISQ
jgi:hypothetical protein